MLKDIFIQTIKEKGSISFYEYMKTCQEHPAYGYYSTKPSDEILGLEGDFVTSPEITSLFGEMIAFWVVSQWDRLGKPFAINILELGAGRGILMQDILVTLTKLKSFASTCQVHVLEINPSFRQLQTKKLHDLCDVTHHASLDFLNGIQEPMIIIANEFFDALPAQQYLKKDDRWYEVYIAVNDLNELQFEYIPYEGVPQNSEIQPDTITILDQIYKHIQQQDGAALIIDYGYWEGNGNTVQALYHHQNVGVLDYPGEADISVHVNFQRMAEQADRYELQYAYQTQRQFLMEFGIVLRAQQQLQQSNQTLLQCVNRLIDPAEMGYLFKVLQVWKN
ncbi:MAG: SAM-dependent methyltransferase [Alphaproteobacteria bacterium]|nr:SAM-dependent methyltransferase [Alphaproteobacteria bacterium]